MASVTDPSPHLNLSVGLRVMSLELIMKIVLLIMILLWIFAIYIFSQTLRGDSSKKYSVKKKILLVFYSAGTIFWVEKPEEEEDTKLRKEKENNLRRTAGSMMIEVGLLAIASLFFGIYLKVNGFEEAYQLFIWFFFPFASLVSFFFFFLWILMYMENKQSA